MPDLIKNFAYCALAADVTAGATTLAVDTISRLPSDAELLAGDFYMTIDEPLTTGGHEIVKVTATTPNSFSDIGGNYSAPFGTNQSYGGGSNVAQSFTPGSPLSVVGVKVYPAAAWTNVVVSLALATTPNVALASATVASAAAGETVTVDFGQNVALQSGVQYYLTFANVAGHVRFSSSTTGTGVTLDGVWYGSTYGTSGSAALLFRLLGEVFGAITVTRGQEGTTATAHQAGRYLKNALTTGILARQLDAAAYDLAAAVRGEWASGTPYGAGDIATRGGVTWVATGDSTGATPGDIGAFVSQAAQNDQSSSGGSGGAGSSVTSRFQVVNAVEINTVEMTHFGGGAADVLLYQGPSSATSVAQLTLLGGVYDQVFPANTATQVDLGADITLDPSMYYFLVTAGDAGTDAFAFRQGDTTPDLVNLTEIRRSNGTGGWSFDNDDYAQYFRLGMRASFWRVLVDLAPLDARLDALESAPAATYDLAGATKGTWSNATAYTTGQIVEHLGKTYVAVGGSTAADPAALATFIDTVRASTAGPADDQYTASVIQKFTPTATMTIKRVRVQSSSSGSSGGLIGLGPDQAFSASPTYLDGGQAKATAASVTSGQYLIVELPNAVTLVGGTTYTLIIEASNTRASLRGSTTQTGLSLGSYTSPWAANAGGASYNPVFELVDMVSGSVWSELPFSGVDASTLATATHAHVGRQGTAPVSTVGAGLPVLNDRKAGDLHYNQTDKQEYVLTGLVGGAASDSFGRPDGALIGSTTETGGLTWANASAATTHARIVSGQVKKPAGQTDGYAFVNTTKTGSRSVQATITMPSDGAGQVLTLATSSAASFTAGQLDVVITKTQAQVRRAGQVSIGTYTWPQAMTTGETHVYAADFNATTGVVRVYRDDVLVYTAPADATSITTHSAYTWMGITVADFTGDSAAFDNFSFAFNGTLAWVSTDEHVATHTHADGRQGIASVSTVAAGLPLFAGRRVGDQHVDSTVAREYVLTGAAGTTARDTFSRSDVVAGLGTPDVGPAWSYQGSPTPAQYGITNGTAYRSSGSGGDPFMELSSAAQSVRMQVTLAAIDNNSGLFLYGAWDGAGSYYSLNTNGAGVQQWSITRNGTTVLNNLGAVATGTTALGLTVQGGVVRAYVNDVLVATYTDTTPLTGTKAGFRVAGSSSGGTRVDNWDAMALGASAWTATHAEYSRSTSSAGLPSFAGRKGGDLHLDTDIGRTFTLTGVGGASQAYALIQGSSTVTVTQQIALADTGGVTFSGRVINDISNQVKVHFNQTAQDTGGYYVSAESIAGPAVVIRLRTDAQAVLATSAATSLGFNGYNTYDLVVTHVAGRIQVFLDGNRVIDHTISGTPDTGRFGKVVIGTNGGGGNLPIRLTDVTYAANGTLAWVHSVSPVETANVVAAAGAAQTIPDVTTATLHALTLTANTTLTFPTAARGKSFTLALTQDATGSWTVTWPGTVKWPGGTAPTLTTTAAKTDVLTFACIDGTNWLGFAAGLAF